ncbi:unnamed protein product [Bathycoccus prasinos]
MSLSSARLEKSPDASMPTKVSGIGSFAAGFMFITAFFDLNASSVICEYSLRSFAFKRERIVRSRFFFAFDRFASFEMAAISLSTAAMTALMASDLTSGTGTRVGGVVGFSAVRICVPGMTGILRPPNADGNSGISKFPGSSGISKLPGNCISGNLKLPGKDGISGISGILSSGIADFSATATGVDFASISRFAADFFAPKLGNADFLSEAAGGVGGGGGVAFLNPVPNPLNPDFLAAGGGGGGGGVGVLVAFLNPVPKPPNADFLAAGGGGGRGGVGVAFLIPVPNPKLGFFAGGGGGGGGDSFFTPPNTVNGFFFTGSGSGAGVEASVFFAPKLKSGFFAGGGGGDGGGGGADSFFAPKLNIGFFAGGVGGGGGGVGSFALPPNTEKLAFFTGVGVGVGGGGAVFFVVNIGFLLIGAGASSSSSSSSSCFFPVAFKPIATTPAAPAESANTGKKSNSSFSASLFFVAFGAYDGRSFAGDGAPFAFFSLFTFSPLVSNFSFFGALALAIARSYSLSTCFCCFGIAGGAWS